MGRLTFQHKFVLSVSTVISWIIALLLWIFASSPLATFFVILVWSDEEVIWDNVRVLNNGESVSVDGTWVLRYLGRIWFTWFQYPYMWPCDEIPLPWYLPTSLGIDSTCTITAKSYMLQYHTIFSHLNHCRSFFHLFKSPWAWPARQQWKPVLHQPCECGGEACCYCER